MNNRTSKKRKFLLIAGYAESLLKFRGELIKALISKGFEVHVAAPEIILDSQVHQRLSSLGCIVHDIYLKRTGVNPVHDVKTVLNLCFLMLKVRPDFVLTYTVKPVIYGIFAAWVAGVKNRFALITGLGYAFTGNDSGKRAFLRYVILRLYSFSLSRANFVFFQNPDDERLFRDLQLLATSAPSCVVNGSGVDLSQFSVVPLPAKTTFLLIARLLGDKGVREYANAAQIVKAKYPQVKFKLVGWVDDNPDAILQQELNEWIEAGTLDFLGKLDDVRPAISESTVYVLPSYREGTPRTVLEAMAMGRAVITTDAPGCRETVVDGENGFLIPIKDVGALTHAMFNLIENPDLHTRMGQKSREVAESKYDVHKVNALMIERMGIL